LEPGRQLLEASRDGDARRRRRDGGQRQSEARDPLASGHLATRGLDATTAEPSLSPEAVLALQGAAGNGAVGRMLMDPGRQATPALQRQPTPEGTAGGAPAKDPEVGAWVVRVEPGGQGAGIDRIDPAGGTTRVFPGDKAIIRAQFQKLATSDHEYVGHSVVTASDVDVKDRWADAKTREWQVGFTKVGTRKVQIELFGDAPIDSYTEEFRVVSDLADFTLACVEAQSRLRGKFDHATRHINQAASAFRKAFAEQQEDLDAALAHQKMVADLVIGAIFAAAGGFVGGALGGWLKNYKDAAYKSDDWLIDTAKDTVKFGVRSVDKLIRGGPSPAVQGDSTAPGRTDPDKPRGMYKASGKDPLDFLADLGARVAGEGEEAQAALTEVITKAREARSTSSKAEFDEDPVAIVSKALQLELIIGDLPTDKKYYVKGLWKTWLETYAWRAYETGVLNTLPAIRRKIDKAAKELGESADEWFVKWADPAGAWNAKKQKELEEQLERQGGYDLMGP
jgi:hypothetical protein